MDDLPVSSRDAETRRLKDALASHEAALLATVRFLVREEADARDLVQQTFETALRHLGELRDEEKLPAWLTTIAVGSPGPRLTQTAGSPHGPWRLAASPALTMAMPIAFFSSLGLHPSPNRRSHNPSNRRIRTRMYGGVGGEEP